MLNRAYGYPVDADEQAAGPLAGGIAMHGYQCGLLWGAALAAGAQAYRQFGPGTITEWAALAAAQKLVTRFRTNYNFIDCRDITIPDWHNKTQLLKFLLCGGPVKCMRTAAIYARQAYQEINGMLGGLPPVPPSPPMSCAALLAQKTGLSARHTAMAAGLAGGIGLSGGACGALGAAVWIAGLEGRRKAGESNAVSAKIDAVINAFAHYTRGMFECESITEQRFDTAFDHADYLRAGGCSEIIDLLADILCQKDKSY